MGTKRFSWSLFSSLQYFSQSPSESSRHRRDPVRRELSPRSDIVGKERREWEQDRGDDWKRQRELERVKERKREDEKGSGQGYRERDRHVTSEREALSDSGRCVNEKGTGGTYPRMTETPRDREGRLRREAERRRHVERERGMEREEYEKWSEADMRTGRQRNRERDAERDRQRYREMERQGAWQGEMIRKEYQRNEGMVTVRDRGKVHDHEERQKYLSPRYRNQEGYERATKELRTERERERDRERQRDREREDKKQRQHERGGGSYTLDRQKMFEREGAKVSEQEGQERRKERWRDTKSEGDSEGETLREREMRREERRLRRKHSKSDGDYGQKHNDRNREKAKKEDRVNTRYTDWEKRRENYRYQEKFVVRGRDLERYEERDRYQKLRKEQEVEKEGVASQVRGRRLKHSEEHREWKKPSGREEEETHHHQRRARERLKENQGNVEIKNAEEQWKGTGKEEFASKSNLVPEIGEEVRCKRTDAETEHQAWRDLEMKEGREMEMRAIQQRDSRVDVSKRLENRQRLRRMWLEPQRHVEQGRLGDTLADRGVIQDMQEYERQDSEGSPLEERAVEWEEDEIEDQREYDDDDDDERTKSDDWLIDTDTEMFLEREDMMGVTAERDSEVGKGSMEQSPSESDRESERHEAGEGRTLSTEDGFVTVSSGGEEEHEESYEDCREFIELGPRSEDTVQPTELLSIEPVGTGAGTEERRDLGEDREDVCETYRVRTEERRDLGEDREDVCETYRVNNERTGGDRTSEGEGDVTKESENMTEDVDEDSSRAMLEDGKLDTKDSKVTVFCVIGQTLPVTGNQEGSVDQTALEEKSAILENDTGVISHSAAGGMETVIYREEKEEREMKTEHTHIYETLDSDSDQLFVHKEVNGHDDSEINIIDISLESQLTDNSSKEDGDLKYFDLGNGNAVTGKNDIAIQREWVIQKEGEVQKESYLEMVELGQEGEHGRAFREDLGTEVESCLEHEVEHHMQTEPILQTTDELTKEAEQCEEQPGCYLKHSEDTGPEAPGACEENPVGQYELQENGDLHPVTCQQMDTKTTSSLPTNDMQGMSAYGGNPEITAHWVRDTDVLYSQTVGETHRHDDTHTSSGKEEEDLQWDKQSDGGSYAPDDASAVEEARAWMGAQGDVQVTTGDESGAEEGYLRFTKAPLTKSNSCPSPVQSPSRGHVQSPMVAQAQQGVEVEIAETESSSSFRELGNEARSRRRGIRKVTDRRKEEEGMGRDRRTRIFNVSVDDDDNDELSLSCGEAELRTASDIVGRSRKKTNSRFFSPQLYQQYSEVVQNQEILRQSRSDVLSSGSPSPARRPLPPVPPPHSFHFPSGVSTLSLPLTLRPPSPRLSVSLCQSPTLWQDLPVVRGSRQLIELSEDERRLQEVRFEVITSEASYYQSLDIVVDHFVKSKQLGGLLTAQEKSWLFSRLADVKTESHIFLSTLEEQVEKDIMHFTVCDIIIRHCPRFRQVYVPYLTNQSYQDKTYQRLMEECPGFRRVVENLERSPVCQRLPLRSFLVLPFQRITRLKLLVQNIVKRTAPNTKEEAQAIRALRLLEKIIQDSNDSIDQMKSIESLVSLSSKVDFECRTLPLVSQSRRLVREGPVSEMRDYALKETDRLLYLHLFNDYLLLSLLKEGGKFTVIDHAPTAQIRVENCRVKLHSLQENLFRLHLSPHKALLLRTDTQSDKLRWMSALSRPHAELDYAAAQDFAQVQCIKAFVAQQPDEITLEKADILLVHQQSSDGWVEGTRLSDRLRGWVPESHLETIVSERARQRNLLETQKIRAATSTH